MAEAFPDQYEVVMGLGLAYYVKEDFAKAVPHLERATTIRPAQASLLTALGNSYVRLGDNEKAKAMFERSLALEPNQEEVKKILASLTSL